MIPLKISNNGEKIVCCESGHGKASYSLKFSRSCKLQDVVFSDFLSDNVLKRSKRAKTRTQVKIVSF